MTTIPGTGESIAACHHLGRLVVALFHDNRWYVKVGQLQASGDYTFSAEQPILPVGAAKNKGHLYHRKDNVIEFAYINNTDEPRVKRCHNLSMVTGIGTWD